jgi:predicted dehydrogenase
MYPFIEVVDTIESVFSDKSVDAIVIATPVASHFDIAVESLGAGKHVLVEKPMARSVAEVEQIGRIAKEGNLVAMVGHTFLYNAAVRCVKKLIDSGELGDIRYIYSQRLNLGRIRSDVDVLWNLAPHDISIIQYWLGDPVPVSVVKRGIDFIQYGLDDVVFSKFF